MLTRQERDQMAMAIIERMREAYDEEGESENVDLEDGLRYLRYDATDEELAYEYQKWVKQVDE